MGIYTRALLPYDCRSCKERHQYVLTNKFFIVFCCLMGANIITLFETTNYFFHFFLRLCQSAGTILRLNCSLFHIKTPNPYEIKKSTCSYRRRYFHHVVTLLALCGRRHQCLAAGELILRKPGCPLLYISKNRYIRRNEWGQPR